MDSAMSLPRAVHSLIADINQLNRLYQQLQDVPPEVDNLFQLIDTTLGRLLDIGSRLAYRDASILSDKYILSFTNCRNIFLDLELFIDPAQSLLRSGFRKDDEDTLSWSGINGPELIKECNKFYERFSGFGEDCMEVLTALEPISHIQKTDQELGNVQITLSPFQTPPSPFLLDQYTRTPALSFTPQLSPLTSPLLPPVDLFNQPVATLPMASLFSPYPFPRLQHGETLAHLPTISSPTIVRRKRPEKTLAERKITQLLQQHYGHRVAAGVKRKRLDPELSSDAPFKSIVPNAPFPPNGSPILIVPSTPPPRYPPSSPRLGPRSDPTEVHPAWSLDDLNDALPSLPMSSNAKGKQRAPANTDEPWESGSSSNTGSSLGSAESSLREGSVNSSASRDRAFGHGAVKLWYHRGTTLQSVTITHIEIRRTSRPSGDGTVVIARTSSNQDIVHDLWLPEKKMNCAPFLDNCEIVAAMRDQHDEGIEAMVHFAPNVIKHPQYSFASKNDCWDFMQMVTGKTLIASIDIATLKSACTHGNISESGCATIQIWEDSGSAATRTIKFFRNKNEHVSQPIVEVNVNCLRPPEKEGRTGKCLFAFMDVQRGVVREMKYLKIAFSNDLAKEEFLTHCGFAAASASKP